MTLVILLVVCLVVLVKLTDHGILLHLDVNVRQLLHFLLCSYITLCLHVAIRCPALPTMDNGIVIYSSNISMSQYVYGATATFQCDSGYELTGGDTVRTCTGDGSSPVGQWNGTATVCTGKSHTYGFK